MSSLTSISRGLLLGTVVVLVVLKIPVLLIGWPTTFYLGLALELTIVGLLATKRWRLGCWVTLAFAASAIAYHFVFPGSRCGCMGVLENVTRSPEVLLASIMGLLAAVSLVDLSRSSPDYS